ncbi:MAG: hypothetical protein KDA74_07960 [Planctomycetaceae bacterium]|nr:hypothetical protein [Planctomycetaceae bacterium]
MLYGPITLCIGLFAFLIGILYLTQHEIYVGVDGMPLSSRKVKVQPMSADMRELLELSGRTGWKKDPEIKARVMELSKSIDERKALQNSSEKKPIAVLIDPEE